MTDEEDGLKVLRSGGWLAAMPPALRDILLPMARWRWFDQGAIITLAGENKDDLIGLAQGTVVFMVSQGLPETPIIHMASAPFWMGYGPMLLGRNRVVTAEARTRVLIASFPKSRVLPLLDDSPGWWRPFMALMAEYGDINGLIASDLLIQNSAARCAAVLLRFGGARFAGPGDAAEVQVPMKQEELAAASNLSRNSAGVILRRFAAEGLVQTGYGGITITDPAGLRRVVS